MAINWDKVSVGLDGIVAALALSNRGGGVAQAAQSATATGRGFFVSLLSLVTRIWEETGGSMKDESEMLEAMFSSAESFKAESKPLTLPERKKVSAVMRAMDPSERKVFRIALFLMDPETVSQRNEHFDKDGKITARSEKMDKTGVDPRINVLRGIAEMVADDLTNVAEVANILRGAGTLGGENKALRAFKFVLDQTKSVIAELFEVRSVSEITFAMVRERGQRLLERIEMEAPDPSLPRPDDDAGGFVKALRAVTPGSFPAARRPRERRARQRIALFGVLFVALLAILIVGKRLYHELDDPKGRQLIDGYQPTVAQPAKPPASSPAK